MNHTENAKEQPAPSQVPFLSEFSKSVGITVEMVTENCSRLHLTTNEGTTNAYGIIHGGVLATLADNCMGIILRAANLPAVTLELAINYLSATKPGDELIADGQVVHFGGSVITTQCMISSTSGKKIAIAKGTFFLRKHQ
ncbi:PaaI family thioesterase [Sporomusa sp. KB1]|uniref:PaaI family thioesterase n=1 Tax=Sporomusa sp. KB1 TaxID=943346 RepID=UPI0011AD3285|nr:PaaI family thioesterase [Sporomusa sp. KB1]TWH46519.1 acyl-CoA thioesterase [Sporomusa sp. KB1]